MVAGHVGERVDVLLGDLVPVGGAELLTFGGAQLVESGDRSHGRIILPSRWPDRFSSPTRPISSTARFYALPDSITSPDGSFPVNALLGSVNQTLWCVERWKPRAVVKCFGQEAADYRIAALPRLSRRTARRCPRAWPRSGTARPRFYEALGWAGADEPRPRGRRPDALAGPRRGGGGRHGADPHRRPRHVPVGHRQDPCADAARAPGGARRARPGRGRRALRRRARARARTSSRCAATRPTACPAPRASARRPPPTCSSARATSST